MNFIFVTSNPTNETEFYPVTSSLEGTFEIRDYRPADYGNIVTGIYMRCHPTHADVLLYLTCLGILEVIDVDGILVAISVKKDTLAKELRPFAKSLSYAATNIQAYQVTGDCTINLCTPLIDQYLSEIKVDSTDLIDIATQDTQTLTVTKYGCRYDVTFVDNVICKVVLDEGWVLLPKGFTEVTNSRSFDGRRQIHVPHDITLATLVDLHSYIFDYVYIPSFNIKAIAFVTGQQVTLNETLLGYAPFLKPHVLGGARRHNHNRMDERTYNREPRQRCSFRR